MIAKYNKKKNQTTFNHPWLGKIFFVSGLLTKREIKLIKQAYNEGYDSGYDSGRSEGYYD